MDGGKLLVSHMLYMPIEQEQHQPLVRCTASLPLFLMVGKSFTILGALLLCLLVIFVSWCWFGAKFHLKGKAIRGMHCNYSSMKMLQCKTFNICPSGY
jgi:hypothetical protein